MERVEDQEIRRAVDRLVDARNETEAETAWQSLRPLGARVVPYLVAAYPTARRAPARVELVFHCIRYARIHDAAFKLGITALDDRASLVRYRACGLLAYSLRDEALPALRRALTHPDRKTAADAAAAVQAITERNHHLFIDRDGTGRTRWIVNPEDEAPSSAPAHTPSGPLSWLR